MITKEAIAKELLDRKVDTPPAEIKTFHQQDSFVTDGSRYIAACCTRRAGKSTALALKFLKSMEKNPGTKCLYLALTRISARQIMWPVFQELEDTYNIGFRFVESKLEIYHPNGSVLIMLGADSKMYTKRIRGQKFVGVAVDESQDFGAHLQSLVNDILTPSIADYADSWLALTGTPGPIPVGFFFDVTQNNQFGYSNHHWSILDNPFMPDAKGFIEDLRHRHLWDENNPTLQREWKGLWVLDKESLWIRYDEKLSNYNELPPGKWNYVIGLDIGYKDADAIAVLAWSNDSPNTYLVEEDISSKQVIEETVKKVDAFQKKYKAYKIVIDEGGLGKKIAESIRQRFGCPLVPAEKERKQDNVEFLNADLKTGRFKAKKGSRFAEDSFKVQINWEKTTPTRIVLKDTFHSDIIDAVLYAFKESYGYTHRPGPEKLIPGTPDWINAQEKRMFELELEGMRKAAQDRQEAEGIPDSDPYSMFE